jgi:hypothetical protein
MYHIYPSHLHHTWLNIGLNICNIFFLCFHNVIIVSVSMMPFTCCRNDRWVLKISLIFLPYTANIMQFSHIRHKPVFSLSPIQKSNRNNTVWVIYCRSISSKTKSSGLVITYYSFKIISQLYYAPMGAISSSMLGW